MRTVIVALFVALLAMPVQAHQPQSGESRQTAPTEEQPASPSEPFWQRATSDPVAAFTGVLVLFTAVLATVSIVQLRFLNHADETARTAANAARDAVKVAERQFLGTMRPRLHIRQMAGIERDDSNNVEYEVVNSGSSGARIIESWAYLHMLAKNNALPVRPLTEAKQLPAGQYLAPGEATTCTWIDPLDGLQLPWADVTRDILDAFIIGYIVYVDDASVKRRTGFVRRYDPDSHRFDAIENPDYEYAD